MDIIILYPPNKRPYIKSYKSVISDKLKGWDACDLTAVLILYIVYSVYIIIVMVLRSEKQITSHTLIQYLSFIQERANNIKRF